MQKNARIFLGLTLLCAAAGMLLRRVELDTALDLSTMLMALRPVSILLLLLTLLAALAFFLLGRAWLRGSEAADYGRTFHGKGLLAVSAAVLLLMLAGSLFSLRLWKSSVGTDRIFPAILALLGVLTGADWFSLALEANRSGKAGFPAAVLPVLYAAFFLISLYKSYAYQPALLYTLYPFLGLCCALLALHLSAGLAVGRGRNRWNFFCAGLGAFLCAVSFVGAPDWMLRCFFAALALMLAAQGACLLQPPLPPAREAGEGGGPEGEQDVPPDWTPPIPWAEEEK